MYMDRQVLVAVLQACASLQCLCEGKRIHRHVMENGFESDPFVMCSLVHMYVQCKKLTDAFNVFKEVPAKNIVLWNTMIAAFAEKGHLGHASQLVKHMQCDGLQPSIETLNAVISGFAQNGYGKEAIHFLQQMQDMGLKPNEVTWNGVISGFARHGDLQEALQAFLQMQQVGMEPDELTYISILKACCNIAAWSCANLVHAQMIENGIGLDVLKGCSILNANIGGGSLNRSYRDLGRAAGHGVEEWNSLILKYARQSKNNLALICFDNMLEAGVNPDLVTFTGILSACSHLGWVGYGCHLFLFMTTEFELMPSQEHVNCMIDLLGRSGSLMEAEDLMWSMPYCPDNKAWRSLLAHCRTHREPNIGCFCYRSTVVIDEKDYDADGLLSNCGNRVIMQKDADYIKK